MPSLTMPFRRHSKTAYDAVRRTLREQLDGLDPEDPKTLTFAVGSLISRAHFDQKDLAQWLGVSRTTVGRWV